MKALLGREAETVSAAWAGRELDWACRKLEQNMPRFGDRFPSACAEQGKYRIKDNDDWTNGFWTGMMWIAYQHTGNEKFLRQAGRNIDSFEARLQNHVVLDHHDIGFLYSLSAGAGYRILGTERWGALVLKAADVLAARFQEKGGFLQAWGPAGAPNEYRLIIDSLLNLPLLYQAYHISGKEDYRRIADRHYRSVTEHILREDDSTYHTFYFHPEDGTPSHGATHQGFSDDSCWARGQAWAILGIPLHLREEREERSLARYDGIVDYYLSHLAANGIPYWDLAFQAADGQSYDSSAAAIAACGLLEAEERGICPGGGALARGMMAVLGREFTSRGCEDEGILLHGVYAYKEGKGVDQANLWGDYFYMEALMRLTDPQWKTFW